jgi:hypothetical protein
MYGMDTISIILTRSARLLWAEVNLFGEVVKAVINQGPDETARIENLLIRLLDQKGYDDYVVHSITALSENQYECTVGKIAS